MTGCLHDISLNFPSQEALILRFLKLENSLLSKLRKLETMSAVVLTDDDKKEVERIYQVCSGTSVNGICERQLEFYARKKPFIVPKAEFLSEIKKFFCNEHPGVDFCPTPSTLPPVPQQPVVQAPPPLTPEQIQQQQQFLKMQKIISEITTPSGFIGENPGITIGLVVILISGFCFFAALGLSFLTAKKPKPTVAPNRGRRGNQMRKPSKSRHPQRKEKTSSSVNNMENGSKRKDETKEKDEKQKSTYSKSKKNSKESIDSTS
ncbi:unnamed protein product [Caenorhabditis brenneri]